MRRSRTRARLQEEVKSLKQQKGKLKGMSKAEKRDVKARKKILAHEIHVALGVAARTTRPAAAVAPAEARGVPTRNFDAELARRGALATLGQRAIAI